MKFRPTCVATVADRSRRQGDRHGSSSSAPAPGSLVYPDTATDFAVTSVPVSSHVTSLSASELAEVLHDLQLLNRHSL